MGSALQQLETRLEIRNFSTAEHRLLKATKVKLTTAKMYCMASSAGNFKPSRVLPALTVRGYEILLKEKSTIFLSYVQLTRIFTTLWWTSLDKVTI